METNNTRHTHPLLLAAAVAVVLFCTFGIAAILGWLPSRGNDNATQATAPAYAVGESGTSAYGAGPEPANGAPYSAGTPSGASSGVSSYSASGAGAAPLNAAPQANYAPGPAAARDYTPRRAAEPAQRTAQAPAAPAVCSNCGVVESIRQQTQRAQGSGVGAGVGAVVGGLLGHQIGGGSGRQIATVAGSVGGAVIGNQVEGQARATHTYVITVRMDNGKTSTFHQGSQPGWRPGDQVRVVNGALRAG